MEKEKSAYMLVYERVDTGVDARLRKLKLQQQQQLLATGVQV